MKSVRISAQAGETIRDFYEAAHWENERWQKPTEAMRTLVIYLEGMVDFAPGWVLTSHENLVFCRQDDYRTGFLSVHPLGKIHSGPGVARYKIKYHIDVPWSYTAGYANTAETAWELISATLNKESSSES